MRISRSNIRHHQLYLFTYILAHNLPGRGGSRLTCGAAHAPPGAAHAPPGAAHAGPGSPYPGPHVPTPGGSRRRGPCCELVGIGGGSGRLH